MKAIAAPRKGEVECVDIPLPPVKDYECLCKVRASALCNSTDLKIIDDHLCDWSVDFPCIIGHEGVGEVVEVGPEVKNIAVGDKFANPHGRLAPGTPYGRMFGGMVEYAIVQDHAVMDELGVDRSEYVGGGRWRVPADMSPEDGSMLLTLKECYSALDNFGFRPGMDVLVYGDGPVGLGLATFLRLRGAEFVGCVGHWDYRLEKIAGTADVDLAVNSHEQEVEDAVGEQQFDLVIDAVGSTRIITEASQLLKPRGKVGVYGVIKREDKGLSLLDLKNNTCVHMLNWPHGEHAVHDTIVQMALDGEIDLSEWYSHVLPAEQAEKGVEMIRSREAFKVVYAF